MVHVRRGLAAPLSFLALLGAAYGSVAASPAIWAGALVSLMAAAWLTPGSSTPGPIGVLVLLFAGWIALTNAFLNPAYSAAAPYHAAFLAGGFFLGRRAGAEGAGQLYGVALLCVAVLAAWALWQKTRGVVRPSAMLETPATLAACLNLILVPGLALILAGKRNPWLLGGLIVVAAGLVVTLSRGGWLAFLAGLLVAGVLLRRARLGMRAADLRAAAAVALAAVLLAFAASLISGSGGSAAGSADAFSVLGPEAVRSSVARLEMYTLALQSLAPPLLLTGYGYLGFHYVLEAGRHAVASYEHGVSYFVHNDYLQVLLELGAPGLVGLVLIVAWPIVAASRSASRQGEPDVLPLAAAAAAGAMAVHALFDFPFYVPVCLLLYGAALGMIERPQAAVSFPAPTRNVVRFSAHAVLVGLAAWLLGAPLLADLAASQAHAQWKRGATEQAAYWFEVARRLERRDARHHWQAGQFWLVQALQNRHPEAARRADAAFADGFAANPRDVRNLLGRIETQRSLAGVLPAPVDAATLMAWSDRAMALAPSDPAVRHLRGTRPGAGDRR
ncbi:MAG TPA: O-antigen ligase family protein [Burkholderiales bacterium]|nr:O-antigen ligase family protein [Burkholderiales bacterium]